jgi:hypothetical protein
MLHIMEINVAAMDAKGRYRVGLIMAAIINQTRIRQM